MSEPLTSELVLLEELDRHFFPLGDDAKGWGIHMGRWKHSEELLWCFSPNSSVPFSEDWIQSVRQRVDLLEAVASRPGESVALLDHDEGEMPVVVGRAIEGESLPLYLERVHPDCDETFVFLLLDILGRVRSFANQGRLLSNLELGDFFVTLRGGVRLEARLSSPFCLVREEESASDFSLARKWVELTARLWIAARNAWTRPLREYSLREAKPFRKLLGLLEKGRESSLTDYLDTVRQILEAELGSTAKRPRQGRPLADPASHPACYLSGHLRGGFEMAYPELQHPDREKRGDESGYLLDVESVEGEQRVVYLLPPERWFRRSFLDPVNRKLANPFLKGHHNTTRVRSIYCEEGFTALMGDPERGVALPLLLEAREGVSIEEVMKLLTRLSRALDQVESANHTIEIESPWQLLLYPEVEAWSEELQSKWIEGDLCDWPAWDWKIRVERPTESFFWSPLNESWQFCYERLLTKAFPALLLWMIEWKRLLQLAELGKLQSEPMSWDPKLDLILLAATEHFEPGKASHRARLLEFLEEISDTLAG